ncbi:MAG TPA: MFS transporter, partial [Candidatus Limnocylindrales bacterium]|nr:MFS transporter [Candidatus Limnocylindrales bacterium]
MTSDPSTHSSDTLRRLILANSVLGVTTAGISTRVFMISVPTLATALNTDMLGISWALIVYQMAGIALGVICGRLGDLHGHHKTYGAGMWVMAAASLLCGLSQNITQLILFRFLQGIGGAMIQSSGRALAFRAMPAGSEGKAQGLMAMSHQLGFFIGPPIGGLIIDLIHWRGIFFLLFVPSLAGAAMCLMTGRAVATEPARDRTIDYIGGVLLFALTIVATLLLDQKIAQVVGGANQLLLGAVFVIALWRFIVHEKSHSNPLISLSVFSVKIFGYGSVGLLFCNINQGLSTFITPFYLQEVLKISPTFMGTIFLVPSLLSMVISPVSGALTDRIGSRLLLMAGVLVLMASFIIGANLRADSHWALAATLLGLTGIGSAFFNTASQ